MLIEQKQEYTLLTPDENSFDHFLTEFENSYTKLQDHNLVLFFSKKINIKQEDLFVFLSYSENHFKKGFTFVVISDEFDVDDFPETFNIVPTLQEAEDVLEMENIQRDLGF